MHISDVLTIIPAIVTLITAIFTEVYKYKKHRNPKTASAILSRVYKPLHQLLQHCIHQNNKISDSDVVYNKYFKQISSIIQTSYELIPPTLYNSYYRLIELNDNWSADFKQFCKLVDIGYNQYRKLLNYPHKSIISEYSVSCLDNKLLLLKVIFAKVLFYINCVVVILLGVDDMLWGPIRGNLSNTRYIIFMLFISIFVISSCAIFTKMHRNNPFASYPLF